MSARRSGEEPTLAPLPRGLFEIGDWRLLEQRSAGAYGSVFRAEPLHSPGAPPVALKLAVHPLDARFMREAALLRRVPPPHAPRLYDFGLWMHPAGPFPYLVMEWIDGMPLYAWAQGQVLSSRQLLRVLAPLARTLEAVHSVQAVHRDVKGDNTLVRKDGHPKLLDFGAGHFQGAPTLTREVLPPGTPGYRSPEALRFHWRHWNIPGARYVPGPEDDLYALGVTAYRLATGRYPPPLVPAEVLEQEPSTPTLASEPPEKWANMSPELARLIHQLLSEEPQARGSAAQVAQQLEAAAEAPGTRADEPVVRRVHAVPAVRRSRPKPQQPARVRRPWLGAAAGLAVVVGLAVALTLHSPRGFELRAHVWPSEDASRPKQEEDNADAGVSLAKEVQRLSTRVEQPDPTWEGFSAEKVKKPLPGQARPPCKQRGAVEIKGGCWWPPAELPPCGEGEYEWGGRCYRPILAPAPPATSEQ
ncbi:MAG TPA: serine/threonine-protein kinase [Hyalangium sp.]|nr:serine/threonine-protein kinase [Hyalangium sp.]